MVGLGLEGATVRVVAPSGSCRYSALIRPSWHTKDMRPYILTAMLLVVVALGAWLLCGSLVCGPSSDMVSPSPAPVGKEQEPRTVTPDEEVAGVVARNPVGDMAPTPAPVPKVGAPSLIIRTFTEEGDVLPGCQLLLRSTRSWSGQKRFSQPMRESGDAVHVVDALPTGEYDVVCSVPNLKEPLARVAWSGSESEELTVRVASRQDLLGGVVRCSGRGLVARTLITDVDKATQAYFCITDDEGRFLFCRKEGHIGPSASFHVSSARGAAIVDSQQPIELFWGNLQCMIEVLPRAELLVRLASRSGDAIGQFVAHAESKRDGNKFTQTAVAALGLARVGPVPTGPTRVLVVPGPQWLPVWGAAEVAADGSGVANLITDPATILDGVVVADGKILVAADVFAHLEPIAESGTRRGSPSEEGGMELAPASNGTSLGVRVAVADGRFVFGCDPRCRYHLRVTAPGYSTFQCVVEATGGVFPRVEVVMTPTHVVRATVTPADAGSWLRRYAEQQGAGAVGKIGCFALAKLGPAHAGERREWILQPDGNGRLEFTDVAAGSWRLLLRGPLQGVVVTTVELGGAPSVDLDPIDLEHLRPGYIRGSVVGDPESGRPVGVSACSEGGQVQVPVGADGSFEVAVPSGDYTVRMTFERGDASLDILRTVPLHVVAGSVVELRLRPSLQHLPLLVVENQSGKPIPAASLSIDEERASGSFKVWKADKSAAIDLFPAPIGEFGLSIMDAETMKWTHVGRVSSGGATPVVIRIQQ